MHALSTGDISELISFKGMHACQLDLLHLLS